MKHIMTAALVTIALGSPALAERRFICEETDVTGFAFHDDRWQSTSFNTTRRFLVTMNGAEFSLSEFGKSDPFFGRARCLTGAGGGSCQHVTGNFLFHAEQLRFVFTQSAGFVGGDTDSLTPFVSIGTCAEM